MDNVFIAHPQVNHPTSSFSFFSSIDKQLFLATVPTTTSCGSSTLLNPSSCSQTTPSNVLQYLFTPCTIGSVTSISPVQGPSGTSITITGTGFSTTSCENIVLIGSSYQCPITSASSTQLVCQIAANSQLNAKSIQSFNVARDRQGFLSNNGLIQFQFQAQISSISPTQGKHLNIIHRCKILILI